MTDSSLSPVQNACNMKNSSPNETKIQRKLTPEEYQRLTDKLLEIEQIKCEARLVSEQIARVNSEKEHLQDLLNILHLMDANDRMRNSRRRQRRLQSVNSKSRFN